jgi:hypothetical protein
MEAIQPVETSALFTSEHSLIAQKFQCSATLLCEPQLLHTVIVLICSDGVRVWLKGSCQMGKGEDMYGGELNITVNYVRNIFICE